MPLEIQREDDRIDWGSLPVGWLALWIRPHIEAQINLYLEDEKLPDGWHQQLQEWNELFGEKGDIVLYPSFGSDKHMSEANAIYDKLVKAIAILAFVPGGVRMFGYHYKASFEHGESKA